MNKITQKALAMLLALALLGLTACKAGEPAEDTVVTVSTHDTAPTEESTPSLEMVDKLANINELEPNANGVYQIKSIEGIQNIYHHLDAKLEFEFL